MKDHVVSLPVAIELNDKMKSAGIEIDNYFIWQHAHDDIYYVGINRIPEPPRVPRKGIDTYILPELMSILPARIDDKWWLHIDKAGAHYLNDNFNALYGHLVDDKTNPVTATAMLIILLIDNGHIKGENNVKQTM